jgi:hypothetical protein
LKRDRIAYIILCSIPKEMPVGIRAVYARITAMMMEFGPNLGMPYVRSLGDGLF